MKSSTLSRAYLETLSSADLISLADEYGIDIPDDLNRQFIIGDLLEVAEELELNSHQNETIILSEKVPETSDNFELPESYNETHIDLIMRNPVSLFVWWDFSDVLRKTISGSHSQLFIRISFFETPDCEKSSDNFDIQLNSSDNQQYVLIPGGHKFVRADLFRTYLGKAELLSSSRLLSIPDGSPIIGARPGEEIDVPPLVRLSGITELLRDHYNEHRQSFY